MIVGIISVRLKGIMDSDIQIDTFLPLCSLTDSTCDTIPFRPPEILEIKQYAGTSMVLTFLGDNGTSLRFTYKWTTMPEYYVTCMKDNTNSSFTKDTNVEPYTIDGSETTWKFVLSNQEFGIFEGSNEVLVMKTDPSFSHQVANFSHFGVQLYGKRLCKYRITSKCKL